MRPDRPLFLILLTVGFASPAARSAMAQFPAELAGQVQDGSTRKPLEGARVRVPVAGLVVETDGAGRFRVKGLHSGEWDVEVVAIGYRSWRTRLTVTDGRVQELLVALEPAPVTLAPIDVTTASAAAGAGISVVDHAAIEAARAPDVAALLAAQPGLVITQQGGPGSPATVSIRGSASSQVLVLLDGVPLNDPTTGGVDLASLPLEEIERITIVRGAATARYGPRALAGVIALERRRPAVSDGWLTLAAGAYGERTARGGMTAVRPSEGATLAASVSGGLTRFAGDFGYEVPPIRGGGIARRANGDGGTNSLLGAIRLGGRSSLTELRADYLDVDRGLPGSIVQPSRAAREAERRIGAGFSTRQSRGRIEWRAEVDASAGHLRYVDAAPPASAPYDDSVRVRQVQATLEASRAIGTFRMMAGGEGRWLDVRASNLTPLAPTRQQVLSGWLRTTAEPTLGAVHPTLSGGLRLDWDDQLRESRWSPSLGVSVPSRWGTVQLSWAMAFAPPTLADQFFQPGIRAQPNPNLKAERVRGDWQAQFNTAPLRLGSVRAAGSVALFQADVDGMILWFPDFRFVWSPNNYDIRRRGAELSASITLPVADLALAGSLSRVDVEYRGPVLAGQVAYRPRTTANLSLAGAGLGFTGTARYRYIGRRRTVAGSELNTLDPFSITDASIARRIAVRPADLEVAVGVDDLFDQAGAMLIDYPAPGRTWRVTLSVRGRTDPSRRTSSNSPRSLP